MRAFAIGCAAVLLLTGTVGCKKKPAEKKADPAGEMAAGDMKPAGDVKPEERPVTQPEKRPVVVEEPKPPVDKEAVAEGVLSGVKGSVEVRRAGTSEFKAAADDTKVFAKDSVRVGKDGEATMALWDNSSVELTPESAITLNTSAAIKSPTPSITVMAGAARFDVAARTEGQGAFSIYTPSAAVAVQGTVLAVGVGLSGNARVAVEEGKVELTPVAKVDGKPLALVAGKVVVVPVGKAPEAPTAYSVEKAGWDEWLEVQDQAAVKNADNIAKLHSGAVDQLNADAQTLEGAEDTGNQAAEELEKKIAAAAAAKKVADYKKFQPQLAANLDRQAVLHRNLSFNNGRRYAHAYLLGLMAGRMQGGVYKTSAEVRSSVLKRYQRIAQRESQWQMRRYKRQMRYHQRVRRHRRSYYLHHADGRRLAPQMKIQVPEFYKKQRLRRRMRRQRVVIAGYNHPLYRRPKYRGKRRKMEMASLRRHNNKTWYANKKWRERRAKRWNRNKAKRVLWKKHAQKRRARWAKRPAYRKKMRQMRRKWRRGMRPGVRPGVGPHGMMRGMGPHGMMRGMGPHGMMRGVGPHGMMRGKGPHGMMRGKGPHGMMRGMDPHRVRGMRFGMRLRGMQMRGHMGVRGMRIRRPLRRRGMGMGM